MKNLVKALGFAMPLTFSATAYAGDNPASKTENLPKVVDINVSNAEYVASLPNLMEVKFFVSEGSRFYNFVGYDNDQRASTGTMGLSIESFCSKVKDKVRHDDALYNLILWTYNPNDSVKARNVPDDTLTTSEYNKLIQCLGLDSTHTIWRFRAQSTDESFVRGNYKLIIPNEKPAKKKDEEPETIREKIVFG